MFDLQRHLVAFPRLKHLIIPSSKHLLFCHLITPFPPRKCPSSREKFFFFFFRPAPKVHIFSANVPEPCFIWNRIPNRNFSSCHHHQLHSVHSDQKQITKKSRWIQVFDDVHCPLWDILCSFRYGIPPGKKCWSQWHRSTSSTCTARLLGSWWYWFHFSPLWTMESCKF